MFPEDVVLVGVVNRKKDWLLLQHEQWYRIPARHFPHNLRVHYLAFYLSGSASKMYASSGVYYYAPCRGYELVRRSELLPQEHDHPRAHHIYFKMQLGDLLPKNPPILNKTRRRLAFILTTWDRFSVAESITTLYDDSEQFVPRFPQ